jgi:hypothetical protein
MTPIAWIAWPALLLAGLLPASVPAAAQGTAQQRAACMDDAYRLCGEVIPDEAKIEACLESRLDALSPACRAQFAPPQPEKTRRTRSRSR